MPVMFNTLLQEAGIPIAEVILLRHRDPRAPRGWTPYELWRDNRPAFEYYQSIQDVRARSKFRRRYWASFVATLRGETLFVGLYERHGRRLLESDQKCPSTGADLKARTRDLYDLRLRSELKDLIGKLVIDWGPSMRSWVQRADKQNKRVIELRPVFEEPAFPGFLNFRERRSRLLRLPKSWIEVLRSNRGVYLLTCPETGQHYVGSASGQDGFWGRWLSYVETGHGGNVELKKRADTDWVMSILQVASSDATEDEIRALERIWIEKLQPALNGKPTPKK